MKDLVRKYPGKVVKAVKNCHNSKYIFEVKYYRNIIGSRRAIKIVNCDWPELMSLLVVSDDVQENAEDDDGECSNDSLDEDNGDVDENNVGENDNEDHNEDD